MKLRATMIQDAQKLAIRRSWQVAAPLGGTVAELFYRRLFELRPEYRSLFPPDMAQQKAKLLDMLGFIVKSLEWADDEWRESIPPSDDLFVVVLALGRRHTVVYKIPDDSYEPVLEALLFALDFGLGPAFDIPTREAWTSLFTLLAQTMKLGAHMVDEPGDRTP